jgi:hypothetical protein
MWPSNEKIGFLHKKTGKSREEFYKITKFQMPCILQKASFLKG